MTTVPVVQSPDDAERAISAGAEWLWWREDVSSYTSNDQTLARLQEAAGVRQDGQLPTVISSVVTGADGLLLGPVHAPHYARMKEVVLAAVDMGLFPIQATEIASALIHRSAIEEHGFPLPVFGQHSGYEWTSRILTNSVGWIAPTSIVTCSATPKARRREAARRLPATVRMTRSGAWSTGHSLVEVGNAVVDVLRPAF